MSDMYIIPYVPKSLNTYAGRMNSWEYRADKQVWLGYASLFCKPVPSVAYAKARVHIKYYFKTKTRHDPDNYSGKMILDGLVKCGIIQDDSFECVVLSVEGGHDKQKPRTEVTVEEIGEE